MNAKSTEGWPNSFLFRMLLIPVLCCVEKNRNRKRQVHLKDLHTQMYNLIDMSIQ